MTIEETFASLEDTISLNDVKKKIQILQDENTFESVDEDEF